MPNIATYLSDVEVRLVSSPVIVSYRLVRLRVHTDDGYIRFRATLINGDFLEAAAYVVLEANEIVTVDYRYQWMSSDKQTLRKRWDTTPDHPHLETFPYHVHDGHEEHVLPSSPMSLEDLLHFLETTLGDYLHVP
jgi:hypothetical protein